MQEKIKCIQENHVIFVQYANDNVAQKLNIQQEQFIIFF